MTLTGAPRALTPRRSRPMTTWQLEWLRLTRSRRWIALVAVYLVFGLIGPVMAKYMASIAPTGSDPSSNAVSYQAASNPRV